MSSYEAQKHTTYNSVYGYSILLYLAVTIGKAQDNISTRLYATTTDDSNMTAATMTYSSRVRYSRTLKTHIQTFKNILVRIHLKIHLSVFSIRGRGVIGLVKLSIHFNKLIFIQI